MSVQDIRLSTLINPSPKQRECFQATDKYRFVLYGGAAGGGKSYVLRWWLLRQLIQRFLKTGQKFLRAGLFSMDYPSLRDRQITKINTEFPQWLGEIKDSQKDGLCFFIKEDYGGGKIALRNLADPSSYKSSEFCDIAVEELTENERDVFEDLVLFRLRWPGIERPCFLGGTNPTGIGVHWVKEVFPVPGGKSRFPKELVHLKHEFHYVPALLGDNPHIGADYRESLKGLPDKKRKALLEGDWTVPQGQYFTNWERSEREVHPSIVGEIVQPWWNHWISQDWGFKHHAPVHWHAVGNVMPNMATKLGRAWDTPRKCVFTYRELVLSLDNEEMSERELGQRLAKMNGGQKISRWILSADAFGKKSSANTPAQMLENVALPRPQASDMSPGSRIPGWRFMYQLIQDDAWFVSSLCPEALEAVPLAEYDTEGGDEDILKTNHMYDDVIDELRYGLKDMLNPLGKPFPVQAQEKWEEMKEAGRDLTERAIMMRRLQVRQDQRARGKRTTWAR